MSALLPHHCPRCPSRWNGANTSHCTSCHITFAGVSAFDAHRDGTASHRVCLPPERAGLVLADRSYPCWALPSPDTDTDTLWENP